MAPNRKQVNDYGETHAPANLQDTIQTKFFPLTTSTVQVESSSNNDNKALKNNESETYWKWEASVEQNEKVVDLFSVANIESNLIQQAAANRAKAELESQQQQVAEHDYYWTMPSIHKTKKSTSQPQHILNNYWQWAADQDSQQAVIANILAEERAFRLVSGAAIAARLAKAGPVKCAHVHPTKVASDGYWAWESPVVAAHTADPTHPNSNYWDWNTQEPTKAAVNPLLETILLEEKIRQLLMVGTIVSQMVSSQQGISYEQSVVDTSGDDYWAWCEDYGEQYWNETPVMVSTGAGYWDW